MSQKIKLSSICLYHFYNGDVLSLYKTIMLKFQYRCCIESRIFAHLWLKITLKKIYEPQQVQMICYIFYMGNFFIESGTICHRSVCIILIKRCPIIVYYHHSQVKHRHFNGLPTLRRYINL